MSTRLPVSRNGHSAVPDARQLAYEQRRRDVAAAYVALPSLLMDDFEKLALRQELAIRLGALQLVATIRRRRTKILEESQRGAPA